MPFKFFKIRIMPMQSFHYHYFFHNSKLFLFLNFLDWIIINRGLSLVLHFSNKLTKRSIYSDFIITLFRNSHITLILNLTSTLIIKCTLNVSLIDLLSLTCIFIIFLLCEFGISIFIIFIRNPIFRNLVTFVE